MEDQSRWHMMYLGAFAALVIPNVEMAKELAERTRTDDEAVHVIGMLRNGTDGDRVYPALSWLRDERITFTVRQKIATTTPGPDGNIITTGWQVRVHADSFKAAQERAESLAREENAPMTVFAGESYRCTVEP